MYSISNINLNSTQYSLGFVVSMWSGLPNCIHHYYIQASVGFQPSHTACMSPLLMVVLLLQVLFILQSPSQMRFFVLSS